MSYDPIKYEGEEDVPKKCCVGLHISKEFNLSIPSDLHLDREVFYYKTAISYLCDKFNIIHYELYIIFHCAGAPENPFGEEQWKYHPIDILNNISCIETYPPRPSQQNFTYVRYSDYLRNIDIIEWLEKERNRIAASTLKPKLILEKITA